MELVNSTLMVIEPLSQTFKVFASQIQILVGGIFGLYIIMFAWHVYNGRARRQQLKKIYRELHMLTAKVDEIEDFLFTKKPVKRGSKSRAQSQKKKSSRK